MVNIKYKLLITTHTCTLKCTFFKQLTLIHWVLNSSLCTPNFTSLFLLITRFFSHPIVSRWWSQRGNAFEQAIWSPALWVWYNSVSSDFQKSKLDSEFPLSLFVSNSSSHFPLSFSCFLFTFIASLIASLTLVSSLSFSLSVSGVSGRICWFEMCVSWAISHSLFYALHFLWIKQIFAASGFNPIQGFERKFILS